MKLRIIQNRKFTYIFSFILIFVSILSLIGLGLKPGLDFSGGSLLEIRFEAMPRPDNEAIREVLEDFDLGEMRVQPSGEASVILRFKNINEEIHQQLIISLESLVSEDGLLIEERFESIGPVIGQELRRRAWWAITLAVMMIIIYIAYAFRKVSKPIASWKYGVAAIIALIHDIIIVAGLFSLLGYFIGAEVDSLFITALLTILGFSVHDTIVVFDRIRENLSRHYSADFEAVVNDSVNQTITRSINTSFTTLLVLVTLYLFGGQTISNFVLALIAGVIIGTYSSIFIASPILVSWQLIERKLKASR